MATMQTLLKLKDFLHERPKPSGLDVVCKLQNFAIITYAVSPERFNGIIPPRFKLDTVTINGEEKALVSVVPFIDIDFTSAVFPFPKFRMGQTNYRIYIIDTKTQERCVWFLGTTLDSWTVIVPRLFWRLPWHPGKVAFDCKYDEKNQKFVRYKMYTEAEWAPASVELTQDPCLSLNLLGFPDNETGLVYLTHPLAGFYYRSDKKLGTYRVWHKQLMVQPARLISANFGLLSRMKLVTLEEQQMPHSVLVEPVNEFTIYLPPLVLNNET
jgi:hypothetical protein